MVKLVMLKVFGRVQGVGFRFYTQKEALRLKINGFVRNMPDGSVYIEAEGEETDLESFVRWCEKGPDWARVDKVQKQYTNKLAYKGFQIR
jgi:acylphosphatase